MKQVTRPLDRKLTIGFLLDWFTSQYHLDVWSGVVKAAEEKHVNLITFVGGRIQAPYLPEAQSNIIYDLAHAEHLDGLLILAATTGTGLAADERAQFVAQYQDVPFVSIAETAGAMPHVCVDNATGMQEGIEHLLLQHGSRCVAFVGGPKDNPDAQERLAAYKQTLAKHGLPVDEDVIFYGDFLYDSGYQAACELIALGMPCDAVVSANDGMAIGVMEAFRHHGIAVPQQVAVIGFDDSDESQITEPPLTTIRQPVFEIGYRAVERLLDEIAGKANLPQAVMMPAKLVLRQSCGCQIWDPTYLEGDEVYGETAVSDPAAILHYLEQNKAAIIQAMNAALQSRSLNRHSPGWMPKIVTAMQDSIQSGSSRHFLPELQQILDEMLARSLSPAILLEGTAVLYRQLYHQGGPQIGQLNLNHSWRETRLLIDSANQRVLLNEKIRASRGDDELRTLGVRLGSQQELSVIFDILVNNLPKLGLKQFYLVLYDAQHTYPDFHALPEWSHLVLAYDESGYVAPDIERQHFHTRQIVPAHLFSPQQQINSIILPLYSYVEQFGYILINLEEHATRYHYDSLRTHLSMTLQSVLPKMRMKAHRDQLESEVTSKAFELALANEQMKMYMIKLEQRNRGLRQFNHVASHEFQEPLRKIQLFCDRIMEHYAPQMDEKGQDYIDRLRESAARLQHLVDDLMNFTQVTAQSRFQDIVDLNVVLDDALGAMQHEITAVNATIQSDELPTIEANASQIRQVFYNLIANSLKFRQPDIAPHITIQSQLLPGATISDHYWQLSFSDNGIGFDEKYVDKIFVMFQRLHSRQEYEGTGIGLAVCQRIVELHNGKIKAAGTPNKGAQFILTLPASQS